MFRREALVTYLEVGLGGVRGVVRDRDGAGVAGAVVMVAGIEKNVTTTEKGEYWRLLAPGAYR
jgi:carboxypeptidase D